MNMYLGLCGGGWANAIVFQRIKRHCTPTCAVRKIRLIHSPSDPKLREDEINSIIGLLQIFNKVHVLCNYLSGSNPFRVHDFFSFDEFCKIVVVYILHTEQAKKI